MSTAWNSRYALRALRIKSSTIRELLKITDQPEMISFGGGLPAPDVFPVQRFEEACHTVLEAHGAQALQYGATEGYEPLREMIAKNMARYGIKAKAENVLITSGSQQALDLIGKLLINSGDRVLVEAPTYLGALQAFHVYGAQLCLFRSMMRDCAPTNWKARCACARSSCTSCRTSRTQLG